jgi:integrase
MPLTDTASANCCAQSTPKKASSPPSARCCSHRFFVRPGELRKAQWAEMDLDKAVWRIPAERVKMREQHIVPLSRQAVAILRELEPLANRAIPSKPDAPSYVFPSARSRSRPMSESAVLAALRRMGHTKDQMTGHGFRSVASTLLHEQG